MESGEQIIALFQRPFHVTDIYEPQHGSSASYILDCAYSHETGERLLLTNIEVAQAAAYAEKHGVSGTVRGNLHHCNRVLADVKHYLAADEEKPGIQQL